jgi:hypothetical protein
MKDLCASRFELCSLRKSAPGASPGAIEEDRVLLLKSGELFIQRFGCIEHGDLLISY